jgi:hypothetical protein
MVGLRPPSVSLPPAHSHPDCRCAAETRRKEEGNDLTAVSQSCVKDEGGPLGIGFQEQVSNQSELLR